MKTALREELVAGSFGLSFGLEYAPGRYSAAAEQKALGDVVGKADGVVMSHMRSEDADKIGAAIDEFLQSDARLHISHLKIVAPKGPADGQVVLEQLAKARGSGKNITADVYPYNASVSDFVFLYPEWAKREEDFDRAIKTRRVELEAHIRKRIGERNGPEAILFTDGPYVGKRLAEVAKELEKPFEQVILGMGYGGPGQAHFLMSEEVQVQFINDEYTNICTDGGPTMGHPRSSGAFTKVLEDYVGPAPRMTLEKAVHKMAGLPGEILNLDRGLIAPGRKADLVVFTPSQLRTRASWSKPHDTPIGIDFVIVNGQVAIDQGQPTKQRDGHVLRHDVAGAEAVSESR